MLSGAVVAAPQHQDERVGALKFARSAYRAGRIGERVIGEDAARSDVSTHQMSASHCLGRLSAVVPLSTA